MDSLKNQDRATRLAVFRDGEHWMAAVPACDKSGETTRDQVAALTGTHPDRLHLLKACNDHPRVAAVDCTDCVPLDE